MNIFLKAAAGVIISVVLCIALNKSFKESAILLSLLVCCMVIGASLTYLNAVLDFFKKLQAIGNLDKNHINVILKATGIGMLAEITNLICIDAGYTTMGKSIKILSAVVILWLALPLMEALLDLLDSILGML